MGPSDPASRRLCRWSPRTVHVFHYIREPRTAHVFQYIRVFVEYLSGVSPVRLTNTLLSQAPWLSHRLDGDELKPLVLLR